MAHPPAGWLQRMALQTKLLLMLITINLLTVLVYTGYAAYARQQDEIHRLDGILTTAGHAVPGLLGAGMLDRARTPDAISRQEYREQSQRLRHYADQTGLAYLYVLDVQDGKARYLMDSATEAEVAKGDAGFYLEAYPDASPAVARAWDSGQPQVDEYTDKYGTFRSVYLPQRTAQGHRYVIGADMRADSVAQVMQQALLRQLGIGAVMLVLGAGLSWLFARLLAHSLRRVSRQIGQIAVSKDLSTPIRVASRDEIGEMAGQLNGLFDVLRQSLGKVRDVAEHNAALASQFTSSSGKMQEQVANSALRMDEIAGGAVQIAHSASQAADPGNRRR